jgi:hypothetical protein
VGLAYCVLRASVAAAALLVLAATPAASQKTRFDALLGCERHAAVQFKLHNPAFRRFVIERASVEVDRFADKVGNQFISTIYHGNAILEVASGTKSVRFICLHAGVAKGPVFVYTLAD